MNWEVGLGSHSLSQSSPPSLISRTVSVGIKHHERRQQSLRAEELCEQGGGHEFSFPVPVFPLPLTSHTVFLGVKHHERREDTRTSELRSCVNREMCLGSHSLYQSSPCP